MVNHFITLRKLAKKKEKKAGKEMQKTDYGYGGMIKGKKLKKGASKLGKSMVYG